MCQVLWGIKLTGVFSHKELKIKRQLNRAGNEGPDPAVWQVYPAFFVDHHVLGRLGSLCTRQICMSDVLPESPQGPLGLTRIPLSLTFFRKDPRICHLTRLMVKAAPFQV